MTNNLSLFLAVITSGILAVIWKKIFKIKSNLIFGSVSQTIFQYCLPRKHVISSFIPILKAWSVTKRICVSLFVSKIRPH
jgi:hypothetical protein